MMTDAEREAVWKWTWASNSGINGEDFNVTNKSDDRIDLLFQYDDENKMWKIDNDILDPDKLNQWGEIILAHLAQKVLEDKNEKREGNK